MFLVHLEYYLTIVFQVSETLIRQTKELNFQISVRIE